MVTIDCVWRIIVPCANALDEFIRIDGIEALLNILSTRPPLVSVVLLSCLTDICDADDAINVMQSWRSADGHSLGYTLAQLWMQEDAQFGVAVEHGVLADPTTPLFGDAHFVPAIHSPRDAMRPETRATLTRVASDMDLRVKLFVLLKRVGFVWSDINATMMARFITVQNFEALRDGDMWRSIAAELQAEGIRPISPDKQLIEQSIETSVEAARQVQQSQTAIMTKQRQLDEDEERRFIKSVIAGHNDEHDAKTRLMESLRMVCDTIVLLCTSSDIS